MSKQLKVPKRIAGVKIPKGIRKGAVVKFLNTPAGQVVLAQVLLIVGGALSLKSDAAHSMHPTKTIKKARQELDDRAGHISAKLTRAFAAAAHTFRDAMESDQEEMPLAGASSEADKGERPRKKSSVRPDLRSTPH